MGTPPGEQDTTDPPGPAKCISHDGRSSPPIGGDERPSCEMHFAGPGGSVVSCSPGGVPMPPTSNPCHRRATAARGRGTKGNSDGVHQLARDDGPDQPDASPGTA